MKSVLARTASILLALIVVFSSFTTSQAQSAPAAPPLAPRWVPPKPAHTQVMPGQSTTAIEVKFVEGTSYRLRAGSFVTLGRDDVPALQAVLNAHPIQSASRLFTEPEDSLAATKSSLEADTHQQMPDLNLWYRITVKEGTDIEALIDALNALPQVEIAYPAPLPAPPTTPNFESQQGYLNPATGGIGAKYAWTQPGGTGHYVAIVDVEYSYHHGHEDLPSVTLVGGAEYHGFGDDHGTAVQGEVVAKRNGFGVTGIAYGSVFKFSSPCSDSLCSSYDPANAIDVARTHSSTGDVILIEQQTDVCGLASGSYGPMEYYLSVFNAIQTATAAGRNVVEAAGNGSVNLDQAACGTLFNRSVRDSGAIIVGAGAPPGFTQTDRSRLSFSTYGSRVDLQGWGYWVTTTGYGDLYSGSGANQWYTDTFAGTSSASPIVTGSVALLSSIAQQKGTPQTPLWIRTVLVNTGSPQQASSGYPVSQHIGPRPNLKAAINRLGPAAFNKSKPTNASGNKPTNPKLMWGASAGATSYQVCVASVAPCTSWIPNGTATSRTLSGLAQHHKFYWQVRALNAYGTTYANGTSSADWSFTTGPATATFRSLAAGDGWILESASGSGVGGTMSSTANTIQLGDDAGNRQFKSVLAFNTSSLPDAAIIPSAKVQISRYGAPVGTNPFSVLGNLWIDIRKGWFGSSSTLELSDFNAAATAAKVGAFGTTPAAGWYTVTLNSTGRSKINRTSASGGLTQFRLYFNLPTNHNSAANLVRFYSGNYTTAASRPKLVILYYTP